jgi:hypothetical protein
MVDSPATRPSSSRPFPWLHLVAGSILFSGLIAFLLYLEHQRSIAEFQRAQQRRESESFQKVKSGESQVTVYGTPEVLMMLANDPECIRNLTSIYFFIADLSDPRYTITNKLSNVDDIGIYDCQGVTEFLKSIKGMPSVKSIYIESVRLDDEILTSLDSLPNLNKVRFEQLLNEHQIELLSKALPEALIEVADPISGDPIPVQGGTP